MVESVHPRLAWGLASFHTALLVTLLLSGLYATGAAGELLAGLDTVVGLGLYGYLWAVTWWTNRRWLDAVDLTLADLTAEPRLVVAAALRWGAVTGLLFLVGPLVVIVGLFVVDGGLGVLPFVLLAGLIGELLAAAVGALVGGGLATLDLGLVRVSTALVGELLAAVVGALVGGGLATLDLGLVRVSTALVPATNRSTDTA